ncbi:Leucine-rich repeat receptor protein kinase HPCA1 [Linum perenne]
MGITITTSSASASASLLLLLLLFVFFAVPAAATNGGDLSVLNSLKDVWENTPPNWVGGDPCGDNWEGISCTSDRVTSITLSSTGLSGQLSGDISSLSELTILILVGCSFTGPIPESIGSLSRLTYLSLNSNGFTGTIPASIGNLINLYWLDLADNQLEGGIPVSDGDTPGLDLLVKTKHFHFGKNQLTGSIPTKLFNSSMTLIHVLFDSNKLTGPIPPSLSQVVTLEVLRLDRNALTGSVPAGFNNLASVGELSLSNNNLNGAFPNLTGMQVLNTLDLSNNSFNSTGFPSWISSMTSLTTLALENTQLGGPVPSNLFSISNLQTVNMKRNDLNGSLDIGPSYSSELQSVDLQNNFISGYRNRPGSNDIEIILVRNPVCDEIGSGPAPTYCTISPPNSRYSTPPNNCVPGDCSSNQTASPNCGCAFPYTGLLVFRAPSFSDLGNSSIFTMLQKSLMDSFRTNQLAVDSVHLSNPRKDSSEYLDIDLKVFPYGQDHFNRTGVSRIAFVLSNQTFKPPKMFGPFFYIGDEYKAFDGEISGSKKSTSTGVIVGAAVGGSVLVLLVLLAGVYAYRQKQRAEKANEQSHNPFAHWDATQTTGGFPQLKGARCFSFDELKKYTNNFSDNNGIGSGGYGKVYRGVLPAGQLIAIKRAQRESMQGGVEFKTEIELLSRVHHKNVVSLVGFCFEQGEQMLIYEYVPNGTLSDSLSGKSGISMDWTRRLKVALGAARGLAYLHELADPPIIHRDIKTTNILLDERLTAKVADFGLSKLMGDAEKGHVSTQVKGTMGYLDPEYYMTQQLTEKSDVYSYGVVLLELVTGRRPIERGKYIVREVKMAMDKTKSMYNLQTLIDPEINAESLKGIDKFVDLAMSCVHESGAERPTMGDVVKEIELILQQAGLNPNGDSVNTSGTYEDAGKGSPHHPYNKEAFEYSGGFPPSKIEPL